MEIRLLAYFKSSDGACTLMWKERKTVEVTGGWVEKIQKFGTMRKIWNIWRKMKATGVYRKMMGDLEDTIVNDQFQSANYIVWRNSSLNVKYSFLLFHSFILVFINLYVLIDSRSMSVSDRILFFFWWAVPLIVNRKRVGLSPRRMLTSQL